MKSFVRMTKLTSIAGRASYMTNPDKQEEVVIASESVDWEPYIDYEHNKAKTTGKNIEGRELIIALPNEWYTDISRDELQKKVQILAETAVGKSTDLQWAVHWNHDRTNFHVHIIFSERTREHSGKRWDRDIYLTADGKIARKKADRARAEDGSILPPVHRKGDLQADGFSVKDTQYKSKGWLHNKKQELIELYKSWDVTIDKNEILHQYHQGKGSDSEIIKEKNKAVKINIQLHKHYIAYAAKNKHKIDEAYIIEKMKTASAEGKVVVLFQDKNNENVLNVRTIPVAEYISARQQAAAERKKKQMDEEFWRRYRATRDETWEEFSKAQSRIINELKGAYEDKRNLFEQCCETSYDWRGIPEGSRMLPRDKLEELGYFEKRDELNEHIAELKDNLKTARAYMDVAKAHQSIAQSLLTAGADQEVINAAMSDFERAMKAMKNYAENGDFENRRLKAAQFTLEQSQKRAAAVISKLETAEITAVMNRCDNEYAQFRQEESQLNPAEPEIPAISLDAKIRSAEQPYKERVAKQMDWSETNEAIKALKQQRAADSQSQQRQKKKNRSDRDDR